MRAKFILMIFSGVFMANAMAARDHNSTRSNKATIVISSGSDEAEDLSYDLRKSGDFPDGYAKGEYTDQVKSMETHVEALKYQMVIGMFVNRLQEKMRKCDRKGEECFNRAVDESETEAIVHALRAKGDGEKVINILSRRLP